jgi:hypothetical protein
VPPAQHEGAEGAKAASEEGRGLLGRKPGNKFQRFEVVNSPIRLPAQSAANRISLKHTSIQRKIALKNPATWRISVEMKR